MTSLESYLRDGYQKDKQQLKRTQDAILKVAPIFDRYRIKLNTDVEIRVRTWPYRVEAGRLRDNQKFSDSTHCMISFALDAILQGTGESPVKPDVQPVLYPAKLRVPKLGVPNLLEAVRTAKADLIALLLARIRASTSLVASKTFGMNDPLTLTWVSELILRCTGSECSTSDEKLRECKEQIRKVARKVCLRRRRQVLEWKKDKKAEVPRHYEIDHCFQKLRCVHLAKVAAQLGKRKANMLALADIDQQTFTDELYRQLGYYSIPDSRFDPAILVFAMEGALQFDPHSLSDSAIESVIQTLESSQKANPYWRPVTPFLCDSRGMVLFPVSVEIANSMLRVFEVLHAARRPAYSSQIEALLRRYVQWLMARAERVDLGKDQVLGWHSEHVNEPGTIHLWETSQVLLFLVHYCSLLQRKIAAEGLAHAGLTMRDWDTIDKIESYWREEPLAIQPVVGKIYQDFVEIRSARSLMLYGPPGTGKTTVAEQLAVWLKQPLVIVTVSDFLAGAADEVEARAKGIFQVLEEQEDVVVLFDEIDQFLLDRNSKRYESQGGIFQFLTPGMLTKFQNLKDLGRSIFVVATNYEERIDGAIKRQGRFDHRLLLSLPDKDRRCEFLWVFVCKKLAAKRAEGRPQPIAAAKIIETQLLANKAYKTKFIREAKKDLVGKTALFGWGDLKHLVKEELKVVSSDVPKTAVHKLVKASGNVSPSVRLAAYQRRFGQDETPPFEEFGSVLYLVVEAGQAVSEQDRVWINKLNVAEVVKYVPPLLRGKVRENLTLPKTDTNGGESKSGTRRKRS